MIFFFSQQVVDSIEILPCLTFGKVYSEYETEDGRTVWIRDGFFLQLTWITLGLGVQYEKNIADY